MNHLESRAFHGIGQYQTHEPNLAHNAKVAGSNPAPAMDQKGPEIALSTGFAGDDRRLHKIGGTGLTIRRDDFGLSPSRLPQERCRPPGELETSGGQEQPAATSGQGS